MKRISILLAVCAMLLAISIHAQAPAGLPKPGPELKRLNYNVGTWKAEGEFKPFPGMPGGKFTGTEKCEWYSGGFFVMCRSDGTGPMGPQKSVSFIGYDTNDKVYTFHEYTNMGDAIEAKGKVDGDTWHWTSESKMGEIKMSVRVTIKEVSKNESTFKLEIAQNGGEFAVAQESTSRRVPAAAAAKKP